MTCCICQAELNEPHEPYCPHFQSMSDLYFITTGLAGLADEDLLEQANRELSEVATLTQESCHGYGND